MSNVVAAVLFRSCARVVDFRRRLGRTSDTHRADAINSANLGVDVHTPELDALTARGVIFEDCWASTNVTIPSHVALMTATSPRDTGVFDNFTRLAGDARTLAESYRDAGFATFAVVSTPHLSDAGSGLGRGFDRMSAPNGTSKRRSIESIEILDSWLKDAEGQDMFVWLHLFDAHMPYEPPEEFERRYWPADNDLNTPQLVPEKFRGRLDARMRDMRQGRALYHGEVSYLDHQLGKVFAIPRFAQGLIAVTADHGESLGEHEMYWDHGGLYPQTIHVPMILAGPRVPVGQRVATPVFQLDLAQTLLQLSGIKDERLPGTNLLEIVPSPTIARYALSVDARSASITKNSLHLVMDLTREVRGPEGAVSSVPSHRVEMYDLAQDPACERDIAHEDVERARGLRRQLCAWIAAAEPHGWGSREGGDLNMERHLAQLGYTSQAFAPRLATVDPDCDCDECKPFTSEH
jgi:arylsulfatase A-like enzyme